MLSSLVRCSDADRSRELEGGFLSDCDSATEASPSELLDRGGVAGVWASTGASSSSTPAAPAGPAAREPRSQSWLLRLGAPCTPTRRRRNRAHHRLSRTDRARHAILAWRLKRPYLIYCAACSAVTALLLVWNLAKGIQNDWNLPQWKHHRWEEAIEVTIGVLIVSETLLTMRVLGFLVFFSSCWCVFDFCVALLTAVSICYGLEHLGRHGEIAEANVPLLMLRFVLQPARVLALAVSTYRTRQMQTGVHELRVDFNSLPSSGPSFESMVEMR
mmetsp:Transcript_1447/g.3653  ORF Transcript_1447/g.3653 Transcript_1447/m.3653 type:complete len:273 (+) Transcript_1447:120-938(+)